MLLDTLSRIRRVAVGSSTVLGVAATVVLAATALSWPMEHDTPLLHYVAWLVAEQGFVPWSDVLFTSMPGTLALHMAIGETVGWSDAAFQGVGLLWLVASAAVCWGWLRGRGPLAPSLAIALIALLLLGQGPGMVLQRDLVGATLVAAAALFVLRTATPGRWMACGAVFGVAVLIKPHLGLGLPVLWLVDLLLVRLGPARAARTALAAIVGLSVPLLVGAAWVLWMGAWDPLVAIVTDYLPLHVQMTGDHRVATGWDRLPDHLAGLSRLGGSRMWVLLAAVGIALSAFPPRDGRDGVGVNRETRRMPAMLAALLVTYIVYVALSGQYWNYHWAPMVFFTALGVGLLADLRTPLDERIAAPAAVAVLVVGVLTLRLPVAAAPVLLGLSPYQAKEGRVAAVETWLGAHLPPGSRVQPLDWTAGTLQAMHRARMVPASPIIYDYMLYLRPDDPRTMQVRSRLMTALLDDPPPAVLEVAAEPVDLKPTLRGPGTAATFPALRELLHTRYEVAQQTHGVTIWRLRGR